MDRLIIESTEGRIMLGITMFVAIMILIGWVAINEPARMAEFVEQHEGRSIERGAEIFAANCSPCHGINGYGIGGRAPALNNPQFFGYSYLGSVNDEIARLQRELLDIYGTDDEIGTQGSLELDRQELATQLSVASDDVAARDILLQILNIDARLSEDTEDVAARIAAIEAGEPIGDDINPELSERELETRLLALQGNIPTRLAAIDLALNGDGSEENAGLLAQRELLLADLSNAILRGYLPRLDEVRTDADPLALTDYIAQDSNRLAQISFAGTIEDYITTTLIHGRPGSGTVWNGNIMVSWSNRTGGALRDDQLGDLVAYITNWDKGANWTIDDFNAVQQYAILHVPYTGVTIDVDTPGGDADAIVEAGLPEGDVARGELLYNGQEAVGTGRVVGCSGCHMVGLGPDTIGTWTRAENQRITLPEFEGYTAEHYLIESIVDPGAYVVAGFNDGLMPANYGDLLTAQDLADIIAYLETQNQ